MSSYTLKLHFVLEIPQLKNIGEKILDSLGGIKEALDNLSSTLDTELQEIADALANTSNVTPQEIEAVVVRVNDLRNRIMNIIP